MIKLIASDLDCTLFNQKKEITPYTEEMIKKAIASGIYFVPATGRALDSISENVMSFPGIKYLICSNGAAIYEMPEKKRVYERLLETVSVEAIRRIPKSPSIAMEAFIKGKPFTETRNWEDPAVYGATDFGVGYVKRTRTPIEDWEGFLDEHESEFDSVTFVSKDHQALRELRKQIDDTVPFIFTTASLDHLLEIGHTDAGKGTTLKALLKMLSFSTEEAMAFGDADNDKSMLEAVRYGIAMKNATEDLKKLAYAITDSNEEDGVGKAIAKYTGLDERKDFSF